MISKLPNRAPMMPPIVFAAYTLPTSRAGSFAPRPTAASASGKLAPQSTAAGKTDQRQRTKSIWKVGVASIASPGLTGQYGRTFVIEYAAHAIAPVSSNWQTPSARRGFFAVRAMADPPVLPKPRPRRNAARISEKVYVVAPRSSDSRRVQTASAASAVAPESAMVTYTGHAPAGMIDSDSFVSVGAASSPRYTVARASARLIPATITSMATAT